MDGEHVIRSRDCDTLVTALDRIVARPYAHLTEEQRKQLKDALYQVPIEERVDDHVGEISSKYLDHISKDELSPNELKAFLGSMTIEEDFDRLVNEIKSKNTEHDQE